jgi:hypothetical protein
MAGKRGESEKAGQRARRSARSQRGPAGKERLFAETLVSVLDEGDADDVKKLRKVASALVDKAMGGDTAAIREIADRVDGKAGAASDRDRDGEGTLVVEIVRHRDDPGR